MRESGCSRALGSAGIGLPLLYCPGGNAAATARATPSLSREGEVESATADRAEPPRGPRLQSGEG